MLGRDCLDAEAADLDGLAFGDRRHLTAAALAREVDDARRCDERRPDRAQRLGVEVVGVAVRREDDVDEPELLGRDDPRVHPDVRRLGALVLRGQRVGEIRIDEQVPALVTDQEAALPEPPDVGAAGGRLDHSSSRTIRTPATRFASFCFAAQRAVWLRPQSVEKASRSGGASCVNRRTRAATSSGVST